MSAQTAHDELLAMLAARDPDGRTLADRVLDQHIDDARGYCAARACGHGAQRWPCSMVTLARTAKTIPAQRKATP